MPGTRWLRPPGTWTNYARHSLTSATTTWRWSSSTSQTRARPRLLSPKRSPGSTASVSAVGDGESEKGIRRVSEEVAYKMLYALARGGDVAQAESANELRGGLEDLSAYLSASIPKEGPSAWRRLEQAREIFEGVRKTHPEMLEAHIFEGIALDLLERHEDAAAHFDHVERETAHRTSNDMQDLHWKAIYNGAVSYLRNLYALEPIQKAIERLEKLVRRDLGLGAAETIPPAIERLDESRCWRWRSPPWLTRGPAAPYNGDRSKARRLRS